MAVIGGSYLSRKDAALATFRNEPKVETLAPVSKLLSEYFSFATSIESGEDEKLAVDKFCELVREQIGVIVNAQSAATALVSLPPEHKWCATCRANNGVADMWSKLSIYDCRCRAWAIEGIILRKHSIFTINN